MSTRRLSVIVRVPPLVKKAFNSADEPVSNEERLWRERAARMVLDALGNTNLTVKPRRHNDAVRYARRWFKGLIIDDDAPATFDAASIIGFRDIKEAVLGVEPPLFPELEDSYDNRTTTTEE